jgi:hypothetical protein
MTPMAKVLEAVADTYRTVILLAGLLLWVAVFLNQERKRRRFVNEWRKKYGEDPPALLELTWMIGY